MLKARQASGSQGWAWSGGGRAWPGGLGKVTKPGKDEGKECAPKGLKTALSHLLVSGINELILHMELFSLTQNTCPSRISAALPYTMCCFPGNTRKHAHPLCVFALGSRADKAQTVSRVTPEWGLGGEDQASSTALLIPVTWGSPSPAEAEGAHQHCNQRKQRPKAKVSW